MEKVILSGGGTGGHIYPAITIAREIAKQRDTEFLFVGTKNGLESQIVPREGYQFTTLRAEGLKRKLTPSNLVALMVTAGSLFTAERILRSFRPDVVIGTGGYVCGPILMAAALSHIPTLVQEQNVIPGITNRILSRFVDQVAIGYREAQPRFPRPEKCIFTGNPVRSDIIDTSRKEAREKLNISDSQFMVLAAGGSRGARSINNAMIGVHHHFMDAEDMCLYHVTGTAEFDRVKEILGSVDENGNYGRASRVIPYQHDMPAALAAADLVIYRSGAIGLAELAARGVPAILIPYPYAAEGHQTYNARVFVAAGAAKMIVDKLLTDKELIQDIEQFRENRTGLDTMAEACRKLGRIGAGADIARLALKLADQKG